MVLQDGALKMLREAIDYPACDEDTTKWPRDDKKACVAVVGNPGLGYSKLTVQAMIQRCNSVACMLLAGYMKADNPAECRTRYANLLYQDLLDPLDETCRQISSSKDVDPLAPAATAAPQTTAPPRTPIKTAQPQTPAATMSATTSPSSARPTTSGGAGSSIDEESASSSSGPAPPSSSTNASAPATGTQVPSPSTQLPASSSSSSSSFLPSSSSGQNASVTNTPSSVTTAPSESQPNASASPASSSSESSSTGLIVALSISVVVAVIALVILIVWKRRRREKKTNEAYSKASSDDGYTNTTLDSEMAVPHGNSVDLAQLLQKLNNWKIDSSELAGVRLIGTGAQGAVYLVTLDGARQLASKRLVADQITKQRLDAFIAEVQLVATLKYPSILPFVGVAWTTAADFQVLFEYMPHGDLRTHLQRTKPLQPEPWTRDKIKMALRIAEELVDVHSFNPPIVHRDLKARNILLDNEMKAKISDFGVSRSQSE